MIFPAAITDDIFSIKIKEVLAADNINVVVDIGAYIGDSSTRCIFESIQHKPLHKLYALEPQIDAFNQLAERYKEFDWVVPVNRITIKLVENNTLEEVQQFYNTYNSSLNRMSFADVARIYEENLQYLKDNNIAEDGLDWIINDIGGLPDAILMDGSSFSNTYTIEFPKYYGTKVIILDDTRCMKNLQVREALLTDPNYDVFYDDPTYRFGIAIFVRK